MSCSQYLPNKTTNVCRKRYKQLTDERDSADNWDGDENSTESEVVIEASDRDDAFEENDLVTFTVPGDVGSVLSLNKRSGDVTSTVAGGSDSGTGAGAGAGDGEDSGPRSVPGTKGT